MANQVYTIQELHEVTGVHPRSLRDWVQRKLLARPVGSGRAARYGETDMLRAKVIQRLRKQGVALKQIRAELSQMSDEQLATLAAASSLDPNPTEVPSPPPATSYPFIQWESITLARGMVLLVDSSQGPMLRRIADEIYRYYGAPVRSMG